MSFTKDDRIKVSFTGTVLSDTENAGGFITAMTDAGYEILLSEKNEVGWKIEAFVPTIAELGKGAVIESDGVRYFVIEDWADDLELRDDKGDNAYLEELGEFKVILAGTP